MYYRFRKRPSGNQTIVDRSTPLVMSTLPPITRTSFVSAVDKRVSKTCFRANLSVRFISETHKRPSSTGYASIDRSNSTRPTDGSNDCGASKLRDQVRCDLWHHSSLGVKNHVQQTPPLTPLNHVRSEVVVTCRYRIGTVCALQLTESWTQKGNTKVVGRHEVVFFFARPLRVSAQCSRFVPRAIVW